RDIGMTKPDGSLMKRSLIFGAKNHLTTTMQLANFRIDQLFVGSIAGNAQLGIYANAVAFSETMFYLPQAIAQVLRPDLIRSKNEDAAKLAAQGLRISFIILGVVGGAIIVLAPYLLEFAFGKEALEGTLMLRILIVGALGIAATKLCSTALSSRNYPFASAIPIGISMVLTVVLDILLIPELGGKGAAIASTSAYLLAGFSVMFVFARTFKVPMSLMIPRASDVRLILEPLKDLRSRLRSRGDRS
ncbi:MAG TPA: polysaccharide biosynthesis C-terminal domain-containing protein, partial [Solirubrobacterales bacterium]|nr:polysaccharide biosynthesis C-terminal domain-containing protein [Solirubrobacterales bacterium]